MHFLKMSGVGNDFIIIDGRNQNIELSSNKIALISNRKNIGCDQLIYLKESEKADIFMEIYNSDGSISAACGNATRCVAAILMTEKSISQINIETKSGILPCFKNGDLIVVNMGKPKFLHNEIPIKSNILLDENSNEFNLEVDKDSQYYPRSFDFYAVNMGNPHIVTFIDKELSDKEFSEFGPFFENHFLFPERTNIEFAQIISPNHIKVRVWERGAGETLSCGSGACSVGVAAIKKNLVNKELTRITFKGGDLFIEYLDDGSVLMSGGYQKIFSGVIDENFLF